MCICWKCLQFCRKYTLIIAWVELYTSLKQFLIFAWIGVIFSCRGFWRSLKNKMILVFLQPPRERVGRGCVFKNCPKMLYKCQFRGKRLQKYRKWSQFSWFSKRGRVGKGLLFKFAQKCNISVDFGRNSGDKNTEGGRRPSEAIPIPGNWGRPQAVRSLLYPGPLMGAVRSNVEAGRILWRMKTDHWGEVKPIPGNWGRQHAVRSQTHPGPLRAAAGRPKPNLSGTTEGKLNLSRATEGGRRPSEAKPIPEHWGRPQAVRS